MKPVVVVLIFAKWCSHCQNFKPTWDAFVKENATHNEIDLREIEDVVLDSELSKLNRELFGGDGENGGTKSGEKIDGGRGFPTLVKVEGGKISYYEQERSPEMLAKWIGHNIKIPSVSKSTGMKGGKRRKTRGKTGKTKGGKRRNKGTMCKRRSK